MLIECVLKREAPISVSIGNETYNFEPDEDGRRIAEVWIDSHVESFLAVPHLYRKVDEEPAPAAERHTLTVAEIPGGYIAPPVPVTRADVIAELRKRSIAFKVTQKTEALRDLLCTVISHGVRPAA